MTPSPRTASQTCWSLCPSDTCRWSLPQGLCTCTAHSHSALWGVEGRPRNLCSVLTLSRASQLAPVIKSLTANAGDLRDMGSIPGSGKFTGGGHGNPLQYSCLENPMDRGAWWATVHWVTKSRTPLSDQTGVLGQILLKGFSCAWPPSSRNPVKSRALESDRQTWVGIQPSPRCDLQKVSSCL